MRMLDLSSETFPQGTRRRRAASRPG
jgi:hypothetical protein